MERKGYSKAVRMRFVEYQSGLIRDEYTHRVRSLWLNSDRKVLHDILDKFIDLVIQESEGNEYVLDYIYTNPKQEETIKFQFYVHK